jgi:hypothetical protein
MPRCDEGVARDNLLVHETSSCAITMNAIAAS